MKIFPVSFRIDTDSKNSTFSQIQAAGFVSNCNDLQDVHIFPPSVPVCCRVAAKDREQAEEIVSKCEGCIKDTISIYPPSRHGIEKLGIIIHTPRI